MYTYTTYDNRCIFCKGCLFAGPYQDKCWSALSSSAVTIGAIPLGSCTAILQGPPDSNRGDS